eukprot:c15187_g1_i1.p1 GENE.c15187_g1_i1~~c15187_g1_i1.p1  ORF type:complete len:283 (+),score=27.93 c15187_g1_i1:28-876(+)
MSDVTLPVYKSRTRITVGPWRLQVAITLENQAYDVWTCICTRDPEESLGASISANCSGTFNSLTSELQVSLFSVSFRRIIVEPVSIYAIILAPGQVVVGRCLLAKFFVGRSKRSTFSGPEQLLACFPELPKEESDPETMAAAESALVRQIVQQPVAAVQQFQLQPAPAQQLQAVPAQQFQPQPAPAQQLQAVPAQQQWFLPTRAAPREIDPEFRIDVMAAEPVEPHEFEMRINEPLPEPHGHHHVRPHHLAGGYRHGRSRSVLSYLTSKLAEVKVWLLQRIL